jgi:hypothetical protein
MASSSALRATARLSVSPRAVRPASSAAQLVASLLFLRPARTPSFAAAAAAPAPSAGFATRAELAERARAGSQGFPAHVAALFDRIEAGVVGGGMLDINAGMRLERVGGEKLTLHVGGTAGTPPFVFTADAANSRVSLTSPKMGQGRGAIIRYRLDGVSGQWVGEEDSHYLLDLFTRDLLYVAKGYPTF